MGKQVTLEQVDGFKFVDGGVCAAEGFVAGGLHCGLHPDPNKNDLGMLYAKAGANAAGVYTTNKVKGAPILVTKKHLGLTGGKAKAVIMNCKNANTCNADGEAKAEEMCKLAALALGIQTEEVLVASTGVIGQVLPIEPIKAHVQELADSLCTGGHLEAEKAIMTTDTVPKELAVEFTVDGATYHLGGMAKGSGMIRPNMATTLNFITTDMTVSSKVLQEILDDVVQITYNCLSVDGDMSTNDMVLFLAGGQNPDVEVKEGTEAFAKLKEALTIVMTNLTRMLAKDGEGATKLIEVSCEGAKNRKDAITIAKSVVDSNLLKCAIFGEDANWGRILCAAGYADADFDVTKVEVHLSSKAGRELVCRNGAGVAFSEEKAAQILKEDEICIEIALQEGDGKAKAWGCDMTYDYVKINGDYRS